MPATFEFNGQKFTEIDVSGLMVPAREQYASFFAVPGRASDDVLEVLDDVVYESPRLDEADVRDLALLWADHVARQFQLQWFSGLVDGREVRAIATLDPVFHVIFPEQRVWELIDHNGAPFSALYRIVLLEMLLVGNSVPLEELAVDRLRRDEHVMEKFAALLAGRKTHPGET